MRILLAYTSKNGSTASCVRRLASGLSGLNVTVCDLAKEVPNAAEFDMVIVGGAVHHHRFPAPLRHFLREQQEVLKKKKLGLFLLCGIVTWFTYVFLHTELLLQDISPTMVASALLLIVIFSRIRLKGGLLKKLSPLVFGIYLFQLSPVIWEHVIKNAFSFIADAPLVLGTVYVLAFSALIFVAGLAMEYVRATLAKWLKLSVLSEKIAGWLNRLLSVFTGWFA